MDENLRQQLNDYLAKNLIEESPPYRGIFFLPIAGIWSIGVSCAASPKPTEKNLLLVLSIFLKFLPETKLKLSRKL